MTEWEKKKEWERKRERRKNQNWWDVENQSDRVTWNKKKKNKTRAGWGKTWTRIGVCYSAGTEKNVNAENGESRLIKVEPSGV